MTLDHTIRYADHADQPILPEINFSPDFGGEGIHDILLHEGGVQSVTTIRTPEVTITIVYLEVTNLDRGDLHQIIPELTFKWQLIELYETTLHPGFVMMPRRQISCEIQTNTISQLHVCIQIRLSGHETRLQCKKLVRGLITGSQLVLMLQTLELLRETCAKPDFESLEGHVVLRSLKYIDATLVIIPEVLHAVIVIQHLPDGGISLADGHI